MREIAATLTDAIPELSDQDVDIIDSAGGGQHQRHFVSFAMQSWDRYTNSFPVEGSVCRLVECGNPH